MKPAPLIAGIAAGTSIKALQTGPVLEPLENRILLCHALGLCRVGLITQSERCLTQDEAVRLNGLIARRVNGEPIAYITGRREFFGLPFEVSPAVLIPRPETELLVELALARLPRPGRLLDLGTGSGAVAVAIAHGRPDAAVTALDVSVEALAVARDNAAANGVTVSFVQSHWYDALPAQRFDVIAANPPYIAGGDSHLAQGDLRFEPLAALTDHGDGLSALASIVAGAGRFLAPGGWLLMEHGYDQAAAVRALLGRHGLGEVQSWCDLAGIERVSGARAA
jgi:release factor glutamine methyltransferase